MDKYSSLSGPICKFQRKLSVVNAAPGTLFTTLHFLCNLWMDSKLVLLYIRLERLAMDKDSSLLGPFVSYRENYVLWIQLLGLYLQHFIFFLTYEWAEYTRLERLARDKNPNLLGPICKLQRKWSVVNVAPGTVFTTLHFLFKLWTY
jgi:hypothetical protein